MALRRRADADHRASRSTAPPSSAPSSACSPTATSPGSASAPASATSKLPKALVDEAEKRDFPLFEVPYSTPFIAITEKAFARLVNEQYEVLQRGIAVQRRLERLVLEERGLEEIAATIASAVGGTVAVLDGRGERLAGRGFRRQLSADAIGAIRKEALGHAGDGHPFVPSHPSVAGRALAHPVISPGGGPPQAWVVIVRDSGGLGDFERLILQQAVAVVALELMRRRVARETERRLAGDVLAGALGGRMEPTELRRRLEPFGIGDEAAVLVFALEHPAAAAAALERALAADACPAVVAPHAVGGRELLCAVVDAADRDPIDVAADARRALSPERGAVRAAASRPAPPEQPAPLLPRGALRARGDRLRQRQRPGGRLLARPRRLHPAALDPGRRGAAASTATACSARSSRATRSTAASCCARWRPSSSRTASGRRPRAQVYCHRHTLRYRMRKVEELTGRDLSRAHDRIEFWLALRARELVA